MAEPRAWPGGPEEPIDLEEAVRLAGVGAEEIRDQASGLSGPLRRQDAAALSARHGTVPGPGASPAVPKVLTGGSISFPQ